MTPLDVARLEFELHADLLTRALGSGGARFDLDRAKTELNAIEATLQALAAQMAKETTP